MAKKITAKNEGFKEALGIFAVLLGTGLVLLLVFLLSRCDGKDPTPDPHNGSLTSTVVTDAETGINYYRCPIGIGANTLKDVYLTMGAGNATDGIKFYTIMFESPEKFISEPKNTLGGAYVYRSEDTEDITLESFSPVSAGIFMGELTAAVDHFYEKSVADKDKTEDGTKYISLIKNALLNSKQTTPTGDMSDENEFYIRLYSQNYPGLYYEVLFYTDVNGSAYLYDRVSGKTVNCPDELTVRMIG